MSHAIAEIVMPPTNNIEAAVKQAMACNCEDRPDWWDFYVIGGRFSGNKMLARIATEKIFSFYAELAKRKITVSAVQFGKQTICPEHHIPTVDKLWQEMVPGFGDKCILFSHAHDQYGGSGIFAGDICHVSEIPANLECDRLIVARNRQYGAGLFVEEMLVKSLWNGISWQSTKFSGNVKEGITLVGEQCAVADDWVVVTVDFHN